MIRSTSSTVGQNDRAEPCILLLGQYLYTGTIPVNNDFGTCI